MSYDTDEATTEDYAQTGRDRRPGQVEQALDELDEALLRLAGLIEEAHGKLAPALRPAEPRPADDRAAKLAALTGGTSPLRDRILVARSRVRALVGSLGETLERVDL